ncbi:ABC transporter permease/substrate binding protein [Streptomyces sp. NPDC088746]|uniref:ABC transporter permease/substrate binding protein n=1 Tax=Streptomyces sp. NPDC088746 TaxID=3365885 RepID=UPI0038242883
MIRLEIGAGVNSAVEFLEARLPWLFDSLHSAGQGLYDGVYFVMSGPDALVMGAILALIAWWLRGVVAAVLASAGFFLVNSIELWEKAMQTLSLLVVAATVTMVIAVPLGIWAARNKSVSSVLRPVLDFMQTMPAFVYLVPGITFFGVGVVPGIVATIIFAMPPGIRMTELGIRQVDEELVEAAEAFGAPPRAILLRVQLPLALPTVMAGVNQIIMLSLSMVVIAGMVGADGLGTVVFQAISSVDIGLGFEAGLAVVILAMYLDRMTGALNQRISPLGRRALARAASLRAGKALRWRPNTAFAGIGVLVLALLAGGLQFVSGPDDDGQDVDRKDLGKEAGAAPSIGYFPWDEDVAVTYLWKNVLERRGYKPSIHQYDVGSMFTAMAGGQVDVEFDAWLPNAQKQYWDKYKDDLVDIGPWYDETTLEVTVPSYVKGIDSMADLKGRSKEFGGRIIGIEPGTGQMNLLKNEVLPGYGLDKEYEVTDGSSPSMILELQRSLRKREPVAVVLWSPHWAYSKYELTKLKDPKKLWGEVNEIRSLGHKSFPKEFPEFRGWLEDWHMSEEQLGDLEAAIQDEGTGHEEEAVEKWIDENPGMVDKMAPLSP